MPRATQRRGVISRLVLLSLIPISLSVSFSNLTGQEDELTPPPTWQVRLDNPEGGNLEDIWYVDMPPGWHVTTGPAAIFWDPGKTASGSFSLESEIYLFDPKGRREGFGFFFGGADLSEGNQTYAYFLIREGGEFLVKIRKGEETETVLDWAPHPAIASWATRGEEAHTAKNILGVTVIPESVSFRVNGQEVAKLPAGRIPTDGQVGLRVNHNVNIHVTTLDVKQHVP
jgi:hypothetical protein